MGADSQEFIVRCKCGQIFGTDKAQAKGDRNVYQARCGEHGTGHPYKRENVVLEAVKSPWLKNSNIISAAA